MKFSAVPKITEPIDLAEYHADFAGQVVHVWVNPPLALKKERERMVREFAAFQMRLISPERILPKKGVDAWLTKLFTLSKRSDVDTLNRLTERMYAWYAQVWSASDDQSTHWTVEEIRTVYDNDPAFYDWLARRTVAAMDGFRTEQKKT